MRGYSIRDILVKFAIHNSSQSPDTGQNSDGGISGFRISGQSLIKENCHNSRTSDDIDMKLRPVPKQYQLKNFDDDVMSGNCDVIAIFQIFDQLGAVQRPDFGHRICKSYVFINSNLLSKKTLKKN